MNTICIRQHENQRSDEYLFLNNFDFCIWLFLLVLVSSIGFQMCSSINRLLDGAKKLLSCYLRKMQGVTHCATNPQHMTGFFAMLLVNFLQGWHTIALSAVFSGEIVQIIWRTLCGKSQTINLSECLFWSQTSEIYSYLKTCTHDMCGRFALHGIDPQC